jgi:hypothetical protein
MSELIFGLVFTGVVLVFSFLFGEWDDVFKKSKKPKKTYTVKYGDEKITFDKETGKIIKHG